MTVVALQKEPQQKLQQALADFERQFVYPLGEKDSFRIVHSKDYPRFCRSMGEGCCFVYEHNGRVLGTLAVSIRTLRNPQGQEEKVAYVCDVKVEASNRRGFVLLQLMQTALSWGQTRAGAAFSVVMDGTAALPTGYTGRLNIPAFAALGKVSILRIETGAQDNQNIDHEVQNTDEANARRLLARLAGGSYFCAPGLPQERARVKPQWLLLKNNNACGCLEDTATAKQLITNSGEEMVSAHLSGFACSSTRDGARLIRHSLSLARARGFSALFLALPMHGSDALCAELADLPLVAAQATIYGLGLKAGEQWTINSSEI